MSNKKLLEELRKLTPNFKINEEESFSIKDAIEPEDRFREEDEDDSEDKSNAELDFEDELNGEEDEDEKGVDIDGDGEEDDIHSLNMLKSAFNSSDEETQHALVSFARMLVDNDVDVNTLNQFLDEVDVMDDDVEDFEDAIDDEDIFSTDDEEDFEDDEEDENTEEDDEDKKEESFEGDEDIDDLKTSMYESMNEDYFEEDDRVHFTNESAMSDDFGMRDFLD